MRLAVCNDRPLRTWILGFGGAARVVAPRSLAQEIYEEFDAARERYTPRLPFESLRPLKTQQLKMTLDREELLPFAARLA
jgi:hypothetical protein